MKNIITLSLILLFAGSVIAQNVPQQAPATGVKSAQDKEGKDKDKKHHHHRHEHKPGEDKK